MPEIFKNWRYFALVFAVGVVFGVIVYVVTKLVL